MAGKSFVSKVVLFCSRHYNAKRGVFGEKDVKYRGQLSQNPVTSPLASRRTCCLCQPVAGRYWASAGAKVTDKEALRDGERRGRTFGDEEVLVYSC